MSSWSQGKWEADLRAEECHWGRRGGDICTWQRNWERKPGREGVERLRLDEHQRESLVLEMGLSRVWEEHKDQETRQVDRSTSQERAQEAEQEEKVEGHCTGMERGQKTLHPPKCALASGAGMGSKRMVCRPHHCLQTPSRPVL